MNRIHHEIQNQYGFHGGFTISRVYFRWLNNGNIPYIEFWILTSTAKWFIDAIRQRQQTLFVTMSAIMHYHVDRRYFFVCNLSTKNEAIRRLWSSDGFTFGGMCGMPFLP